MGGGVGCYALNRALVPCSREDLAMQYKIPLLDAIKFYTNMGVDHRVTTIPMVEYSLKACHDEEITSEVPDLYNCRPTPPHPALPRGVGWGWLQNPIGRQPYRWSQAASR